MFAPITNLTLVLPLLTFKGHISHQLVFYCLWFDFIINLVYSEWNGHQFSQQCKWNKMMQWKRQYTISTIFYENREVGKSVYERETTEFPSAEARNRSNAVKLARSLIPFSVWRHHCPCNHRLLSSTKIQISSCTSSQEKSIHTRLALSSKTNKTKSTFKTRKEADMKKTTQENNTDDRMEGKICKFRQQKRRQNNKLRL